MKRIFCLLVFIVAMLSVSLIAEDTNSNGGAAIKAQQMINSRVFMEKGGVEKMKEVTSGMSEEWKETQYSQNRKIRALGWLSLAVPSLGNFFVGDKVGGVVSIVGEAGGVVTYFVGYGMLIGAAYNSERTSTTTTSTNSDGYIRTSYRSGPMDYTGLYVMGAGLVLMIGFEVYSVISALSYADRYNNNLKSGLDLAGVDPVELNYTMIAESMNLQKPQPEMIHLNLLTYSF